MNKNTPKTKKECFAQLDAMLSEADKKTLIENDAYHAHFTLGLWIRNNWLYPLNSEERNTFIMMFMDSGICIHPDETSTVIIEKYVEYLKEKETDHS